MTTKELQDAIEQAFNHTQKHSPGKELDEAKYLLSFLRKVQAIEAAQSFEINLEDLEN